MASLPEADGSYYYPARGTTGPETEGLKWLAVDLDGTLAEPVWPLPGIGKPILSNVAKLSEAVDRGWKVLIHTSRPWADYEMIERWAAMNLHRPVSRIVCGKVLAARYIDDRNIDMNDEHWYPVGD